MNTNKMLVLVGLAIGCAAQAPAANSNDLAATIAAKYIDAGAAGQPLPADFAVTIQTHGYPTKESGLTNNLFQAWRFTADSVARLDVKDQPQTTVKFAALGAVCRRLKDMDLVALHQAARGRVTPILNLLGQPCAGGEEKIVLTANGQTLTVYGQNCWTTGFAAVENQQRFEHFYARLRQLAIEAELMRWGHTVDGLQLGIGPVSDRNGAKPWHDGTNLQFAVVLRNSGAKPVRLLPSIYQCLLGPGDPLCVSEGVFTPKAGGPALRLGYQGWNHLSLLAKDRAKGERPQQTLTASAGRTGFAVDPEQAKGLIVTLGPGDSEDSRVAVASPRQGKGASIWALPDGSVPPPGQYLVHAVLQLDQEISEWKGQLTTAVVEIDLR